MRITERNLLFFLKRHQIMLASLFLALISLHLALTEKKEEIRGVLLKEILSVAVSPVQKLVLGAENIAANAWNGYISLMGVEEENKRLKNAFLTLQQENNRLKEELLLDGRLKEVLGYKEQAGFETHVAGIIGFNMDKWTRTVIINKGRADNIMKEAAVISPLGVVGRVIDVNGNTSTVLLNSDPRSNMDVLIQRTRVKGVAEGDGNDGLILKYIRQIDDVQTGDLVVTSGLSGIFPKGIVVGEVTKIEKTKDNFFKHIEVTPKVDIMKLEEVLVLTETGFTMDESQTGPAEQN